jgi:UDP-2-acetamido-3-amino-2,3-dideoxy-glucuronate N-acetyltransferase
MNIGIIGVGRWGKKLLRVFDDLVNVQWCAHKEDIATKVWIKRNHPNIQTSLDYFDILKDDSIKAVVIATPTNTHFQIAKDALIAGKHVFIEKPITVNSQEAKKLIELAKDVILFVGHIFLYHPCYKKLKETISTELPVTIEMIWKKYGTFHENIFSNLLSHDISILGDLFGFDCRNINIHRTEGFISNMDIIDLTMGLGNKSKCKINIDRMHPENQKIIKVNTGTGNLLYWIGNKLYMLKKGDNDFRLISENDRDVLRIECQDFIECIKMHKKPITDGEFGLKVLETVDLIRSTLP